MRYPHSPIRLGLLITLVLCSRLPAQQQPESDDPVPTVTQSSGETKIFSDLTIPEGEVRSGAFRVIGGDLTVAGTVTGRITVLGGDVKLLPTARVEGNIYAIGGQIIRSPDAQVTGEVLEVNRGKVSLSREQADDIFGYGDPDRLERLNDELNDNWGWHETDGYDWRWERRWGRQPILTDFGVIKDETFRYNRAEGVAFYIPFSPKTNDIPGFKIHGHWGIALGPNPNRFYGRLGIGQYLWRERIGVLIEGHKEPRQDDGWRVTPWENFLGALLIHEDWYDWYETEGYGGSLVVAGPYTARFRARYLNEDHRTMDHISQWSLFGGDKRFRPGYPITPGQEVNITYTLDVGHPVGIFPRRPTGQASVSHTQTLKAGDFDYTRQDVALELFVPVHRRLGLRVAARTGSLTTSTGSYGLQHQVPLGGIGSVGGYNYKTIAPGDHYGLIQTAFSLRTHDDDIYALMWHFGNSWNSADVLFLGNYLADLRSDGYHSIGLSLGDEDTRLEIFKPLSAAAPRDWVLYLRLLDL